MRFETGADVRNGDASVLAHSVTLSVAVLELVHAAASLVEPLIALSIIEAAAENML